MKNNLLLCFLLLAVKALTQEAPLPRGLSEQEKATMAWERFAEPLSGFYIPTPPPYPVRHMAEWEELQALAITWNGHSSILAQIARHAAKEVKVVIFCGSVSIRNNAEITLENAGVNMDNIEFVIRPNDSVWIRDYGPNCVYKNDVEDLNFVDWVYNRDRALDDDLSAGAADHFGVPHYATIETPYRLVNTGGNFMSDGQGNAFASKLIFEDNGPESEYINLPLNEAEIDDILYEFMGIQRYTKMETLPYDGIHHIDMHMRLLDEETLLVGQYPDSIADGPQIEANLQYVLDNFMSCYGTPYKVVRIVQPPDFNGFYPNTIGDYRTYTNSVLVNKTVLIPFYEEKYDTTALRIYKEQFPGYKVIGINCNSIIGLGGALHCITKEVGATDPLWLTHQRHPDVADNSLFPSGYPLLAKAKHKTGIEAVNVFYSVDTTAGYLALPMQPTGNLDEWSCNIPQQPANTTIYYYLSGTSNSQKTTVRPLAAPDGYYQFKVSQPVSTTDIVQTTTLQPIYPNPARALTVIPVETTSQGFSDIALYDVYGKLVKTIFSGQLPVGASRYYLDASVLPVGVYFVSMKTANSMVSQKLVVK